MRRSTLNLRHLRAFSHVGAENSISRAADAVHLSQPAVTQAIAKLERRLAVPLFDRTGNGLYLTAAGDIFIARVNRALLIIGEGARLAAKVGRARKSKGFSKFDQLVTSAQLGSLLAVAEAGNFSLAARSAGVSQPSLHRTARDLERLSGLTLFNKTSIGISLTPAATTLSRYVRLAFSELDQGLEEIENWRGADTGRIIIGTMPLARTYLLPHAINALLSARPAVDVSVIDGPYADLLQGLRQGDTDILIGALRDPLPVNDVIQEPLFSDTLAIVGRLGHPLSTARSPALDLASLACYPWVVPRRDTPTRDHFDALFGAPESAASSETGTGTSAPSHVIETSSLVLIRGLLLGSDHLTVLSAHQMRHEEDQGLLTRLPFALPGTTRTIGLTFRRNWHPTRTQSLFLSLLRDAAKTLPPPEDA